MPRQKQFQMSGAKKRKMAQLKVKKERAEVDSYPRLSRFFVHAEVSTSECVDVDDLEVAETSTVLVS